MRIPFFILPRPRQPLFLQIYGQLNHQNTPQTCAERWTADYQSLSITWHTERIRAIVAHAWVNVEMQLVSVNLSPFFTSGGRDCGVMH